MKVYESTKKMKERDGREERECTNRIIYIILLNVKIKTEILSVFLDELLK